MLLSQQPKNIDNYELKKDEVKILRPKYDPVRGEFLGIEYCITLVTVRDDPEEQFFYYGYNKGKAKVLLTTKKVKIPSSFKSTVGKHKMQYEGGTFNEQEHSNIFFYLPSTVDRNKKINKYLSSVHLKPFSVDPSIFGENFNPVNITDRSAVVSYMSKVAVQSSQKLKRNAGAFYLPLLMTMTRY